MLQMVVVDVDFEELFSAFFARMGIACFFFG
jgi:hypothetical protein